MPEMVFASKFDENSDLSATYLGQTNMTRNTRVKVEERFPITGQGFCFLKTVRWHGMSNSIRHRCYKIIHVKIIPFEMQDSTCVTKILIKYSKNSSRKWTITSPVSSAGRAADCHATGPGFNTRSQLNLAEG